MEQQILRTVMIIAQVQVLLHKGPVHRFCK